MKFEQENLNQENKEENKEEKIEDNTVEEVVETIDETALKKQENQALSSIREKIKNLVSNFKPEVVKSPSSQYEPDNESENNTYLNYHSWITENLFIDGFISPTTNNTVQVTYGMNMGYSVGFNNNYFKNVYYSLGYYSKKFIENKQKWSNIAITPIFKIDKSWVLFSFNYSFDYDDENRVNKNSLIIDYLRPITNTIIFRFGIQALDNDDIDTNLLIGFSYKL